MRWRRDDRQAPDERRDHEEDAENWLSEFRGQSVRPEALTAADRDAAGRQACAPPVVIRLVVEYNQLLQRLTGRRSCPTCGLIYNVYYQPPKVQGICDVEGASLVQRRDDTEEVIAERLKAYEQLTLPLVDYYGSRGRLIEVNGDQPVEAVAEQMFSALENVNRL